MRVTEGELKSDIARTLSGLPTVSAPGATNWRPAFDVVRQLGAKTVRLAFDADAATNEQVARGLAAFAEAATNAGLEVEVERWAAADGKGIDDVLAAGKPTVVLTGEDAAAAIAANVESTRPNERPADALLDRVVAILDSGGATAMFNDAALLEALGRAWSRCPAEYMAIKEAVKGRVSVRNLDAAVKPHRETVAPGGDDQPYFERDGGTYRNANTKDGPVPTALCNFTARIVEDVVRDDGAERTGSLALEGRLADGSPLPRCEVKADDFGSMNWVIEGVGHAGRRLRRHGDQGSPAGRPAISVRQRDAADRLRPRRLAGDRRGLALLARRRCGRQGRGRRGRRGTARPTGRVLPARAAGRRRRWRRACGRAWGCSAWGPTG